MGAAMLALDFFLEACHCQTVPVEGAMPVEALLPAVVWLLERARPLANVAVGTAGAAPEEAVAGGRGQTGVAALTERSADKAEPLPEAVPFAWTSPLVKPPPFKSPRQLRSPEPVSFLCLGLPPSRESLLLCCCGGFCDEFECVRLRVLARDA